MNWYKSKALLLYHVFRAEKILYSRFVGQKCVQFVNLKLFSHTKKLTFFFVFFVPIHIGHPVGIAAYLKLKKSGRRRKNGRKSNCI